MIPKIAGMFVAEEESLGDRKAPAEPDLEALVHQFGLVEVLLTVHTRKTIVKK
jgi:hypothetical protein